MSDSCRDNLAEALVNDVLKLRYCFMNKQEAEAKAIREYIGDDAQIAPYLYSNLSLYEKGHPYVKIWLDKNDDGEIEAVYLLYYNCLHL